MPFPFPTARVPHGATSSRSLSDALCGVLKLSGRTASVCPVPCDSFDGLRYVEQAQTPLYHYNGVMVSRLGVLQGFL